MLASLNSPIVEAKEVIPVIQEPSQNAINRTKPPLPGVFEYNQALAVVSAYTASEDETDDTPTITASGTSTRPGIVANNCLRFGDKVTIAGKEYEVQDRMNKRYDCAHFDIFMESKDEAIKFGRQKLPFK